ncbi:MAG TPA: ATP-dependent zinc metalloprotease FtsH [Gemmataceae bacterium]|nr:ATP-dependent zinc metalloprotease FtsH [Gemmataceae bacterium]
MQKKGKEPGRWRRWLLLGLVLALSPLVPLVWFCNREPAYAHLKYGELIEVLKASRHSHAVRLQKVQVHRAEIRGEIVTSDLVSGADPSGRHSQTISFRTPRVGLEEDAGLHDLLKSAVGANFQGGEEDSAFKAVGTSLLSILFVASMAVGLVLILRWMMGGGSPLAFGRSKAKVYAQKDLDVTFANVAGIEEAVAELREVVDFLKTPDKYQVLGGRIPKGVLLVGPPGTGKTLLARAVAGEAEAPFFSLSGSDFVEMFVGVGAARVRDLFAQAESRAPCIIFIDELDALGKTRSGMAVGGHDEREQTLNQLLVEMDGFASNRGVIIMAATNRPETLDAALLRPGRFDRQVVVDRPDILGREAILKVHSRNVRLGPDVDLRRVAALTPGSVGADLANLVNEAALMAARGGKDVVGMADLEEAVERGAVGLERKSRIMNADEKQRVAYHEAGHALVACSLPNTSPVHKISIIPRGVGALGYVLSRPEEDRYLVTQSELESQIKVALGGTLAEELVYREISNGATSDLEQASRIARSMVKEFGMSRLGRVNFHERSGAAFLSGAVSEGERSYSEHTAREIDAEVRTIIDEATTAVRELLLARRNALEAIAQRLMEKEVMDRTELMQLLEQHIPGPRLVPGSAALHGPPPPLAQTEGAAGEPCVLGSLERKAAGDESLGS